MQRVPRKRREGERREDQKRQEEAARLPDPFGNVARREARQDPGETRRQIPVGERRIERLSRHGGDHAERERPPQGEAPEENRGPLYFQLGNAAEPRPQRTRAPSRAP